MNLIEKLIKEGWLKDKKVIDAFYSIKRSDFLREDVFGFSELDEALPIGNGQTISQPAVVAFMLEKLELKKGQRVLDIGSGSGWTTALISHIVGSKGRVFGVEIIKDLKEFGEQNADKYGFVKKGIAEFFLADGSKGLESKAPFDRILCSASVAKEIPLAWKKQLKIGGIIVSSFKESIMVLKKLSEKEFEEKEFPGFVFVPLIEK